MGRPCEPSDIVSRETYVLIRRVVAFREVFYAAHDSARIVDSWEGDGDLLVLSGRGGLSLQVGLVRHRVAGRRKRGDIT